MDGRTVVVKESVSPEHLDSLTNSHQASATASARRWPVRPSSLASMRVYTTVTPSRAAALPMPSVAAVEPVLSDHAETMPSNP
jgi:hypothetical protein